MTTVDPFYPYLMPRILQVASAPEPRGDWALFLDLDGTLIDLAPTPDAVVVPDDLVATLKDVSQRLDGALAIVSGRMLSEVDKLLAPLKLPGAGEHGALVRMPDGSRDEIDVRIPYEWVQALEDASERMKGVIIERKSHGVVAHFRKAPQFEKPLRSLAARLIASATTFEIVEAKLAIEIHPRTVSKARAVDRLMTAPPFAGRVPVFVGDDVTDRDGFRAAEKRGGFGLDVLERFAGRPPEVRAWLRDFADCVPS
jgi:trehalose 6-phosphate phosphatase